MQFIVERGTAGLGSDTDADQVPVATGQFRCQYGDQLSGLFVQRLRIQTRGERTGQQPLDLLGDLFRRTHTRP
ncbi:hypothetical protein [Streptomyces sp. NPDC057375]|uniref:hypothetical protein n=1 Tax=Streptomyces sp. NPDC057375 TaxID=3346109 RepID=UPI003635C8E0